MLVESELQPGLLTDGPQWIVEQMFHFRSSIRWECNAHRAEVTWDWSSGNSSSWVQSQNQREEFLAAEASRPIGIRVRIELINGSQTFFDQALWAGKLCWGSKRIELTWKVRKDLMMAQQERVWDIYNSALWVVGRKYKYCNDWRTSQLTNQGVFDSVMQHEISNQLNWSHRVADH